MAMVSPSQPRPAVSHRMSISFMAAAPLAPETSAFSIFRQPKPWLVPSLTMGPRILNEVPLGYVEGLQAVGCHKDIVSASLEGGPQKIANGTIRGRGSKRAIAG